MHSAGPAVGISALPAAAGPGPGPSAGPEAAPPLPGAVHPRCQATKAPQGRGSRTVPPRIPTRSRCSNPLPPGRCLTSPPTTLFLLVWGRIQRMQLSKQLHRWHLGIIRDCLSWSPQALFCRDPLRRGPGRVCHPLHRQGSNTGVQLLLPQLPGPNRDDQLARNRPGRLGPPCQLGLQGLQLPLRVCISSPPGQPDQVA
jgi:hypothetical protein